MTVKSQIAKLEKEIRQITNTPVTYNIIFYQRMEQSIFTEKKIKHKLVLVGAAYVNSSGNSVSIPKRVLQKELNISLNNNIKPIEMMNLIKLRLLNSLWDLITLPL